MKSTTSITIDSDILKKARLHGLNISGFVELKLREYINIVEKAQLITKEHIELSIDYEINKFLEETEGDYMKFIDGRLELINQKLGTSMSRNEFIARIIEMKSMNNKGVKNDKIYIR